MKRAHSWMNYSAKRPVLRRTSAWAIVDNKPHGWQTVTRRSRSAEKPTRVDVASKSTGRHTAKIINASGVRAVIKAGPAGPARIRITAWRRWTILRGLILLNDFAG